MITATQWTWEYIDEYLTLPRWNSLREHWKRWPPTHITAALFAGAGGGKETAVKMPTNQEDVRKMMKEAAARVALATTADPRKLKWINVPNEARHD